MLVGLRLGGCGAVGVGWDFEWQIVSSSGVSWGLEADWGYVGRSDVVGRCVGRSIVGRSGVSFGQFSIPVHSELRSPKLKKNAVRKMSKTLRRPKIVQVFVITYFI